MVKRLPRASPNNIECDRASPKKYSLFHKTKTPRSEQEIVTNITARKGSVKKDSSTLSFVFD
jgi:hypothetical protein